MVSQITILTTFIFFDATAVLIALLPLVRLVLGGTFELPFYKGRLGIAIGLSYEAR